MIVLLLTDIACNLPFRSYLQGLLQYRNRPAGGRSLSRSPANTDREKKNNPAGFCCSKEEKIIPLFPL